jgi:outer membrane murein-binding lipoprotein Lpp
LIAILAILFAVQNNDPATVSFIAWDFDGSLALILLIAMAVGAVISSFLSLPGNIKARWTIRNQRKKMTELETKIEDLEAAVEEQKAELEENLKTLKEMRMPPSEPALPDATEDLQDENETGAQEAF